MITVLAYPLAADQPAMFARQCVTRAEARLAADYFRSLGECRVEIFQTPNDLRRRSTSSPLPPFYRLPVVAKQQSATKRRAP